MPGLLANSRSLDGLSTVAPAKVEGPACLDAEGMSKVGAVLETWQSTPICRW